MITTQLVALDIIHGAGGSGPTPPPVVIPPAGGGKRHRKSVQLRDGRRYEIDDEDDLRRILEAIIAERQEQPPKSAKVSRKIRQRVKKPLEIDALIPFESWDLVLSGLLATQMAVFSEQALLDFIRNMVLAELTDEEDTEILMWLM